MLLLLVAKPITYLLFVLCFRYRVSTPRALSLGQIAAVVGLRTTAGFVLLITGAYALWSFRNGGLVHHTSAEWVLLSVERAVIWSLLGFFVVSLRGRRLIGWIASAVGIDLAFDFAAAAAFEDSWTESLMTLVGLLALLIPLYTMGRRPSLRCRFLARHMCGTCGYDLRGNMTGVCPECGTIAGAIKR